jgi:hypothetical protein
MRMGFTTCSTSGELVLGMPNFRELIHPAMPFNCVKPSFLSPEFTSWSESSQTRSVPTTSRHPP